MAAWDAVEEDAGRAGGAGAGGAVCGANNDGNGAEGAGTVDDGARGAIHGTIVCGA